MPPGSLLPHRHRHPQLISLATSAVQSLIYPILNPSQEAKPGTLLILALLLHRRPPAQYTVPEQQ
jgi:hypothetical protein